MINKRFALALALPALLLAAAPAFAQAQEEVPDEVIDNLGAVARVDLGSGLSAGKIAPETEEERARPLVSRAIERRTVEVGMLSSDVQRCGLNWTKESFLPFTRAVRATGQYDDRQMVYIARLHGQAQRMMDQVREGAPDCTPEKLAAMRTRAEALATDLP